ncbi:MAG: hypothetical protein N3H30_02720, partial [Candidatus Micrarchaeota archaeon]|nr:hypothetical protein [Candidatus Micrarchaeota archaeon]
AQSSAELLMLLSVVLFVILVAIYLSNEQFTTTAQAKETNEAAIMADDIARAADEVYYQGYGARKKLYVNVPRGIDPFGTSIVNNSIVVKVSDTSITSRSKAPIYGNLPLTPGRQEVWVISEGSYVRIGNAFISLDKGSIFISLNEGESRSEEFTINNVYNGPLNLTVAPVWAHSAKVNLSASPSSFTLQKDNGRTITVTASAGSTSGGVYDGDIMISVTDGQNIAQVRVPVTVYVIPSDNPLPKFFFGGGDTVQIWAQTVESGTSVLHDFYFCTGTGTQLSSIAFQRSGTAASWVWDTSPLGAIPGSDCARKVVSLRVPAAQPPGNYTGTLTIIADGGVYNLTVLMFIEVVDSGDDRGPLVKNAAFVPSNPRYGENILLNLTCDDVGRGNSKILYAEFDVSQSPFGDESYCSFNKLIPYDGAYDSPTERAYANLTVLPEGHYKFLVRCVDVLGNIGPSVAMNLQVFSASETAPPSISNISISPPGPRPVQQITVYATANDTATGNSSIFTCYLTRDNNGTYLDMNASDGAYDSPVEAVQGGIGNLTEGAHNVTIFCQDRYGWVANRTYNFTVYPLNDTQAPLILNLTRTPTSAKDTQQINVSLTANDTARGGSEILNCSLEVDSNGTELLMIPADGSYDSMVESAYRVIGPLSIGTHNITVRCRDIWLNTNTTSQSFTVTDGVGPLAYNLSRTTTPSGGQYFVTAKATATDVGFGGSNIQACYANLNLGAWQAMTADDGAYNSPTEQVSKNLGKYNAGTYTMYVQCVDAQGNWGEVNSTTISVP